MIDRLRAALGFSARAPHAPTEDRAMGPDRTTEGGMILRVLDFIERSERRASPEAQLAKKARASNPPPGFDESVAEFLARADLPKEEAEMLRAAHGRMLEEHRFQDLSWTDRALSARLRVGQQDGNGNVVERIFIRTTKFAIYLARDARERTQSGRSIPHFPSLRYSLPRDYEEARKLRQRVAPVVHMIAAITDTIESMRPFRPARLISSQTSFLSMQERAFELMARALSFAFDGEEREARAMLDKALHEVERRRDSLNRMRYIIATTVSFIVISGLLLVVPWYWDVPRTVRLSNTGTGASADGAPPGNGVVDIPLLLMFGVLGAFFSVAVNVNKVDVKHTITTAEMIYAGFVRIPIGLIAAGVVLLLVEGGWLLGGVDPARLGWNVYLFGFAAGLSEGLVPNILRTTVEEQISRQTEARVTQPLSAEEVARIMRDLEPPPKSGDGQAGADAASGASSAAGAANQPAKPGSADAQAKGDAEEPSTEK